MLTPRDLAECRSLIRNGSRSFHAAAQLLPADVAMAAISLYAFCRIADDAVDLGTDRRLAVTELRHRLDRIYEGRPADHCSDRAFADIVIAHGIPQAIPEALIEGLSWDSEQRRYQTLDDLAAYAARVAGTVGAMMSIVMGRPEPETVARACDLGIAMQLTNIARDIGEDARAGRLYLPLEWLAEAGIAPDDFLADPVFTPVIAGFAGRLLAEADRLYARAEHGIAELPLKCRPGISAARLIYAEIGRELERNGLDSISRRAVVPGWRKLSLVVPSLLAAVISPASGRLADTGAGAAGFLVDAVVNAPPRRRRFDTSRIDFVLTLFEKLERRDQLMRQRF